MLAAAETRGKGGFAAVFEHQQVLFQTQPPIPAVAATPDDQLRAAVEAVPHQHRANACRQQAGDGIQRRTLRATSTDSRLTDMMV